MLNFAFKETYNSVCKFNDFIVLYRNFISSSSQKLPPPSIRTMHVVKARALKAKAKAWTLKAKDMIFFLEDPRGQGLSSRTTSLQYDHKSAW
jgi:hypothetical protein